MKIVRRQRPSGITTLACFEFLGAISCFGLLFFTPVGSRDFIALLIGAFSALSLFIVYGPSNSGPSGSLRCYESLEIVYELYLMTQPEYRNLHLVGPAFGILMSAITIGYIFLDRSVKPIFRRTMHSGIIKKYRATRLRFSNRVNVDEEDKKI